MPSERKRAGRRRSVVSPAPTPRAASRTAPRGPSSAPSTAGRLGAAGQPDQRTATPWNATNIAPNDRRDGRRRGRRHRL